MRKLKLQMHISIDGFVAGLHNEPVTSRLRDDLRDDSIANLEQVDRIILGRKTAVDFIPYWASVPSGDPDYTIARKITELPKVVFSKTLKESEWDNTKLAKGEIVDEINQLKNQPGNDMIVYGGSGFVSSLIEHGLIDEYYLFINPAALGDGLAIFKSLKSKLDMTLVNSKPISSGIVLHHYIPIK